ncbi:hypothetical protein L1987_46097 [Smallanthus sonchifolius]|uniref:Uncharacterized protein n=1 Tax=Smallanthus sonchifolius TaxID=185202 RepID=A0ACB9FZU0_9ASTR|nr:hypothetical protein L1987_46097 [Smallanthus sonchifolius]
MADVKGKESSKKVSSVKVDSDEISLYKHHNQILLDELNKSLAVNTDLKEAEKAEEEIGSEDESAESISKNVGEFVMREEVVSDRMNDRDAYQFSENDFLYFPEDFNKEIISFHVNDKVSDESNKFDSKIPFSSQNVKT